MAAATTVVAMRVASDKEGESSKAMETVTRLAGEQRQWQQIEQWQWQHGGRRGCGQWQGQQEQWRWRKEGNCGYKLPLCQYMCVSLVDYS
jgi:hypothetical protein